MRTPLEMTYGFLIQLVFCKKKTMWFIGVEVEQETSAPPPKKIVDPPLPRQSLILDSMQDVYIFRTTFVSGTCISDSNS